jgi:hypothetical protein
MTALTSARPSILLALAGLLVLAGAAGAQTFPTEWISLGTDPNEGGSDNDHRDVIELFYNVDGGFLFLRMATRDLAGWPDTSGSGKARFKWFFDTANDDGVVQGGRVRNAEYMLMLEDLADNGTYPAGDRDLLGEIFLLDDLANVGFTSRWNSTNPPLYSTNAIGSPLWIREIGSGTPGVGGPQSALGTEIGYRIDGVYVDMYIDLALLGNPSSLRLLWLTDQQDTQLEQAPCCDRPDDALFIVLPTTGTISIVKEAIPEGATDFDFTSDLGAFTLTDDGTVANTETFLDVEPGTYDFTESVPTGWALGAIVCDEDRNADSTVDVGTATVSVVLEPGETVACTFFDTLIPAEGGTITIIKDTVPDGATVFGFTGDLGAFQLSDSSPENKSVTFTSLTAGAYDVTETLPVPGFDLTAITCVDPDSGTTVNVGAGTASIDLDDGEVVTCTFVNVQQGSITIVKEVQPDSMSTFDFLGDGGIGAFSLSGNGDSDTFANLTPGTYNVEETGLAGHLLVQIACIDPDGGSSTGPTVAIIDLDAGESITCTFTNVLPATLTVAKDATPADGTDFEFTSGITAFVLDDAVPDDNDMVAGAITFSDLGPGVVDVTELVPPGWVLAGLTCDDPTGGSVPDLVTATVSVDLAAGDEVTCTFVNREVSTVSIPTLSTFFLGLLGLLLAGLAWRLIARGV